MHNSELCVPAAAVAIDGTNPAQGDEVELASVKGKVTRVEGDKVYLQPTEANGQPLPAASPQDEVTDDGLSDLAAEHDRAGPLA